LFEDTTSIFFKEVETLVVNQLTSDFQSDLVTPSVNEGHRQIIKEKFRESLGFDDD
jgi:hypothetical protein